jgi:hypothetical protein
MAHEDAKGKAEQEQKKTKGKAKAVVTKVGSLARGFVAGM